VGQPAARVGRLEAAGVVRGAVLPQIPSAAEQGTAIPSRRSTMEVQIFGTKKDPSTRKALRFFAERRIRTHMVDLTQRAASKGELTKFAQKFGVQALIDRDSRRFAELGLAHAGLSDARWLEKLADEPLLLRQPLVRSANRLTVGPSESIWKEWAGR
jgi:arsenate reductase-like glutaredoxin family protein